VVVEGVLDAPRGGGADALVDRQRLPQVRGGLAGVGVVQVGLAEPFQGACFLRGRAELATRTHSVDPSLKEEITMSRIPRPAAAPALRARRMSSARQPWLPSPD
jgi:hypothetical protein